MIWRTCAVNMIIQMENANMILWFLRNIKRVNQLIMQWRHFAIHRFEPTLAQVMAWCLKTPGHYLKQCWLIINMVLRQTPLQRRHNGHDSVSRHQPHDCLRNRLFRQIKENIKAPRHWPLCGKFTEVPAQMASNAEKVSIWWRHHA